VSLFLINNLSSKLLFTVDHRLLILIMFQVLLHQLVMLPLLLVMQLITASLCFLIGKIIFVFDTVPVSFTSAVISYFLLC
jgi:hypothetical protein